MLRAALIAHFDPQPRCKSSLGTHIACHSTESSHRVQIMSTLTHLFPIRFLHTERSFVLRVILTMAIGLTVAILMLAILWQVQWVPLPYARSQDLHIVSMSKDGQPGAMTGAEADLMRLHLRKDVGTVTNFMWNGATYTGGELPEVLTSNSVDTNWFDVLGAQQLILLGRGLRASDEGTRHIVLGEKAWRRYFNSDPHVIGKSLSFKGGDAIVVGVISQAFAIPVADIAFYEALDWQKLRAMEDVHRNARFFETMVRLEPNADPAKFHDALSTLRAQNVSQLTADYASWKSATDAIENRLRGSTRKPLLLLGALSLLVLIISAVNAGQLMLVREQQRATNFAVMSALGAPKSVLLRKVITEALSLSTLALIIAGFLCWAVLRFLPSLADSGMGISETQASALFSDARLGLGIALVFLINLVLAASIALWMALRKQTAQHLRNQRSGDRTFAWLGLPGIALSVLAMSAAGLYWYSARALAQQALGLDVSGIQNAQIFMEYNASELAESRIAKVRRYFDAAKGLSSTQDAIIAVGAPFSVVGSITLELTNPISKRTVLTKTKPSMGDSLAFFGQTLLRGRSLSDSDSQNSLPVVLVNEQFARQYFASTNPIGQTLMVPPMGEGVERAFTIVGVFNDARSSNPSSAPTPEIIMPYAQYPFGSLSIMIKNAANPEMQLRNLVRQIDPEQAIYRNYKLSSDLAQFSAAPNFFAQFGTLFACLALLLCAFGMYAVQSFSMEMRRKEFALRQAVGASRNEIMRKLWIESLRVLIPAVIIGVACAWAFSYVLQSAVYGLIEQPSIIGLCITLSVSCIALTTFLSLWFAAKSTLKTDNASLILLAS
jgi:putative ABC transport system permease protein